MLRTIKNIHLSIGYYNILKELSIKYNTTIGKIASMLIIKALNQPATFDLESGD